MRQTGRPFEASAMDEPRHDFFAGAGFAFQDHRRVRCRDPSRLREYIAPAWRLTDPRVTRQATVRQCHDWVPALGLGGEPSQYSRRSVVHHQTPLNGQHRTTIPASCLLPDLALNNCHHGRRIRSFCVTGGAISTLTTDEPRTHCPRNAKQSCKLLNLNRKFWRREWDSNSW